MSPCQPITWRTIIIRRFKEEWWLGFWRWQREVDVPFVIRNDTTMDFIYGELRRIFHIANDSSIQLVDIDNQVITKVDDLLDNSCIL